MDMGEKIKSLREQKGMTLEELGNKVGVGKSTVRKWETGMIANMRRDKIAKVANALDVDPAYLMGWEDEPISQGVMLYLEDIKNKLYVDEIAEYIEKLNDAGKAEAVERVKELTFNPRYAVTAEPALNAAHERTDIKVTEAMRKHDDDIMSDEDF